MTGTLPLLGLGSISHGTLRAQDLASALLGLDQHLGSVITGELEAIAADEGRDEEYDEEVINDAIDALQEYAPPFCYVGMHEGDGSDLGVWFNSSAFDDACHCGEVLKIADLAELDGVAPADFTAEYIALVSDHGNVTLYRPRIAVTELWGIV